jgi:hypothetical protein
MLMSPGVEANRGCHFVSNRLFGASRLRENKQIYLPLHDGLAFCLFPILGLGFTDVFD